MNADTDVMEFFVAPLTREQSDAFVDRIEAGFAEHGFGVWAVEELRTGAFVGFAGLLHQTFEAPFTHRHSRSATGSPDPPGARATPPRPPERP
jgi:RimJ/RimL family protein N-acetyltransferase